MLRSLQTGTPDIVACTLISDDGLVIASALPQHMDEMRVAGMSATLLSLGSRAASELGLGPLSQVLVRGEQGNAVLLGAGRGTLLLAITTPDAKLGLVFLDMKRCADELSRIL